MHDMRREDRDHRRQRAVGSPVKVIADRAVVDEEQRPRVVRMRLDSMLAERRVEHLADARHARLPGADLDPIGRRLAHRRIVQDPRPAAAYGRPVDGGWLAGIVAFSVVSSVTPGPNNLLLWASGAEAGFARTLPHVAGTALGLGAMALAVAAGLQRPGPTVPQVTVAVKVASSLYFLWLAGGWPVPVRSSGGTSLRPMTVWQAIVFQLVNVKAWIFALGAITTFEPSGLPALVGGALVATIMALVILPTAALWAGAGDALSRLVASPGRRRVVNVTLAALLVLSIATVWV